MMNVEPYRDNEEEYTIYAERYRNIIFLSQKKERNNSRFNPNEYMGEKAEQLLLTSMLTSLQVYLCLTEKFILITD